VRRGRAREGKPSLALPLLCYNASMQLPLQQPNPGARLRCWLDHLWHEPQQLVALAMITPALLSLLFARDVAVWRLVAAAVALLVLLAFQLISANADDDLERGSRRSWAFILAAAALTLAAIWLSNGAGFTIYLLFLLVGQATWALRMPASLLFIAALLAAFLLLVDEGGDALDVLSGLAPGVFFTVVFTLMAVRYAEQTERAETLLRQLQQANSELEAARIHEKELAAAEERMRMARDIHDGLGHHLTVLNVQLQAAEKLLRREPARAGAALATSRTVAAAALDEVRQSVATLRRSPLDGRTLEEALAALVQEFGERAELHTQFTLTGTPVPLTPPAATTLYRAAQEGLTNARKHAAARHVRVALVYLATQARLIVHDDGTGRTNGTLRGGFGLSALRERAEQLGGTFAAGPRAEGGFTLELAVPTTEQERSSQDKALP
jgi:signal transduction histidine kinase